MTSVAPGGDELEVARRQTLLYAADLAKVHRRLREDERRLARLGERLEDLSRVCLDVAAASSLEEAGERAGRTFARWLGARDVVLLALRRGRFRVAATVGDARPARASLTRQEVGGLEPRAREAVGAPWAELGLGAAPLTIGLPGRAGHCAGVVVTSGARNQVDDRALDLLARLTGMLLEAQLAQELSVDARGAPPPGVGADGDDACAELRGSSGALRRVRDLVGRLGPVSSPVLILGETGTGKELAARALHRASPRRKGPFVAVNCGALPEQLVESEVFGHEAGSFTGAQRRHRGKVEQAQGGTLFLDELGELPRAAQVKLLRFLQDARYTPVGGEEERVADVRVVAATNRDLAAAVAAGTFREDLLYRLNVFTLELPPLRARDDDVVELARDMALEVAARVGRAPPAFTPAAERLLRAYRWPGNVRELRNVVERAVVLSDEGQVDLALLPRGAAAEAQAERSDEVAALPAADGTEGAPAELDPGLDVLLSGEHLQPFTRAKDALIARFEARYCEALLARTGGNIAKAARLAELDKKHLRRKLVTYGLIRRPAGDDPEVGE